MGRKRQDKGGTEISWAGQWAHRCSFMKIYKKSVNTKKLDYAWIVYSLTELL